MRKILFALAIGLSTVAAPTGAAEAYTPWACGTVRHTYAHAAGSISVRSTVAGCAGRVAIKCSPGGSWLRFGNLAYSGHISTKNCGVGSIVIFRGHQMGTNW